MKKKESKTDRKPAETFPVCEFLREEVEFRGWSIETFCKQTGLSRYLAEEILSGSRRLTPLTARCLENGMGISSIVWLRLQKAAEAAGEK